MSAAYDVRIAGDGKVIVLLHPSATIDRASVVELLVSCGIDPAMILFLDPGEAKECAGLDGAPVVVPIDGVGADEAELEEGARDCAQAGGRVIVVLDAAYPSQGLHPIASNYGTQCGWSPEQLGPRLGGDAASGPLSGSGDPAQWSSSKPVKCGG